MSECLGDARYTKSIYALLSRSIVWSLLCYCVRDNDHCCVLCDVTRDLLFAKYIVHQPNVYQYGVLIFLASLRQGLDYLPVNSKTSYPQGILRAFFRTVGNLTQNLRPDLSGIDLQNVGPSWGGKFRRVCGVCSSELWFSRKNNCLLSSIFPAGEGGFRQMMYWSPERSSQDSRDGFFLYTAQASFSWPRVDLVRLLSRACSRSFWIISFEFVKVCGIRLSIRESFIGFYIFLLKNAVSGLGLRFELTLTLTLT